MADATPKIVTSVEYDNTGSPTTDKSQAVRAETVFDDGTGTMSHGVSYAEDWEPSNTPATAKSLTKGWSPRPSQGEPE